MTPQELKNSILQLAIQGKLVEQRVEEGTAAELLRDILTQRRRDAEVGRSPRDRRVSARNGGRGATALPPIPDDEKPFDIPESWEWVRLESIINSVPTKQYQILESEVCSSGRFAVISQSKEYSIGFTDKSDKVYRHANPVIVFGDHTAEVKYVEFDFVVGADGVKVFEPKDSLITAKLLFYILQHYSCDLSKVGGYSRHYKFLKNKLIPLPPLAEQKRIVAKIEELLPLIDRYEKAWSRLEDFNKRFPVDMQKSLLQLAIQGKLVDQRAEEGTAAELLRDILTQRRRDAEVGRSPRDRRVSARNGGRGATALPPIPDDEKPFDIPESWEWVRLGEIGSWASGATPSRTHSEYYGGSIPWLKTGDLTDGYVSSIPEYITDLALEKNSVRLNPVGSVLMAMYGATIGKLGILQIAATTNQACCACIPYDGVWNKYLFYYLMARRKAFIKMGEGGAQPNISKEKIVNALIPLPPLAEQKRIVAKLEELLPLCERLK